MTVADACKQRDKNSAVLYAMAQLDCDPIDTALLANYQRHAV